MRMIHDDTRLNRISLQPSALDKILDIRGRVKKFNYKMTKKQFYLSFLQYFAKDFSVMISRKLSLLC